jgi:GH35 family endo-1,4-beta-xylanase
MRILDRIAAHYAVTETNEREMLHFHEFVWLIDNIEFLIIRDRVKIDSDFANRMIEYLKSVIKQNLQKDLSKLSSSLLSFVWKISNNIIDDDAFMNLLNVDANHVTVKKNMHKHNATCHKYDHKECKFNFSRSLQ